MKLSRILTLSLLAALFWPTFSARAAEAPARTNVLLIISDDLAAGIGSNGLDDPPSWAERFNPKGLDVEEQAPLIVRVQYDAAKKMATLAAGNKLTQMGATLSWLPAEGGDSDQTDGKIADKAIA